ncbi:MAG: manganese efflux pump MntP family protein [Christensenellaceae bacterium]|nr:manganese efflux pump MntP family protein [Christensenellaceae bacterium]
MTLLSALLLGLGLAMDAFAVSIATGICLPKPLPRHALKTGLFFGGFQFLMPLIGYLFGSTVSHYITAVDHWIAFALLLLIGGKMLYDAIKNEPEDSVDPTQTLRLLILAVATSIDALAVGVSLALVDADIWQASACIGLVTFALCAVGVMLGKRLGQVFQRRAMLAGGLVLCFLGCKILIEHLLF